MIFFLKISLAPCINVLIPVMTPNRSQYQIRQYSARSAMQLKAHYLIYIPTTLFLITTFQLHSNYVLTRCILYLLQLVRYNFATIWGMRFFKFSCSLFYPCLNGRCTVHLFGKKWKQCVGGKCVRKREKEEKAENKNQKQLK